MSTDTYRIMDEPSPGRLAGMAVRPMWAFLIMMLGGPWIGWPLLGFNSLALGSASARRELVLLTASMVLSMLLAALLVFAHATTWFDAASQPYLAIALTVVKLGFAMAIYHHQERSAALFEYYGGSLRAGYWLLAVGIIGRGSMIATLKSSFWTLVLV